jgi:hypothetical protein
MCLTYIMMSITILQNFKFKFNLCMEKQKKENHIMGY